MSENKKYTVTNLLNNDDFISWVNSKNNNTLWIEIIGNLSVKEKIAFTKAESIIKKIRSLKVGDTNISSKFVQEQYIKLLEASSISQSKEQAKPKVLKLNRYLKYAAALALLISLSAAIYNSYNSNMNSFSEHLLVSDFNQEDILLQISDNEYYKITEATDNKWLTIKGEFVSINSGNISFVASDDIKNENSRQYKLFVPTGKKFHLTLIDGTEVELNSNSTLSFNNSTISKQRNVSLKGEAFFDVAHNKERPFIVESSDMIVEALGTEFNISDYNENEFSSTTLVNGSIRVSNLQGENKIIKPGEQAKLFHNQDEIIVNNVDVQKVVAWTSGRMIFRNETLENLIPRMNRWFDVEFVILDKNLKDYQFTGTLKKENDLIHFLQILKYTRGVSYKIENKQVKLFINDDK